MYGCVDQVFRTSQWAIRQWWMMYPNQDVRLVVRRERCSSFSRTWPGSPLNNQPSPLLDEEIHPTTADLVRQFRGYGNIPQLSVRLALAKRPARWSSSRFADRDEYLRFSLRVELLAFGNIYCFAKFIKMSVSMPDTGQISSKRRYDFFDFIRRNCQADQPTLVVGMWLSAPDLEIRV